MANLLHFAVAVASVVALLIVCPRRAQRKAIGALTEYADMESSRIYDHVEGQRSRPNNSDDLTPWLSESNSEPGSFWYCSHLQCRARGYTHGGHD
jgi:hypothetical protein